jgi:hypothetical protein
MTDHDAVRERNAAVGATLDLDQVIALVMQAVNDPGSFTKRGDDYEEPIYRWSRRALAIAVTPLLADRDALAAEVERQAAEADENEDLRARMERLLIGAANGLKGDPGPLTRHDWSDLPVVAAEARAEIGKLSRLAVIREDQLEVAKRERNAARARVADLEAALAARCEDMRAIEAVNQADQGALQAELAEARKNSIFGPPYTGALPVDHCHKCGQVIDWRQMNLQLADGSGRYECAKCGGIEPKKWWLEAKPCNSEEK